MKNFLANTVLIVIMISAWIVNEPPIHLHVNHTTDNETHINLSDDSLAKKNQPCEDLEDQDDTRASYYFLTWNGSIRSHSVNFRNPFKKGYPHLLDEPPEFSA